ncbi:hypothetical protein [Micromonospora endolithica]|nr:hypothetical protein [Micromonospora endolithica]TWJ24341.1 hypothetical protein JD76_04490 [Micromonospora endolithica]
MSRSVVVARRAAAVLALAVLLLGSHEARGDGPAAPPAPVPTPSGPPGR